jgi:lipopolysaccharide biosynthesis protein
MTRLIAFYLPQFHPIPENDLWWGKGFTEWYNVVRARPRFPGHHQPRLPKDLGFYDLRLPQARQGQAELAAEYGLNGFCYYHYWFKGRRILNTPFDEVLESGKPNFPFCLCWANESWRRNWDGRTGEILIEQEYSAEDDIEHIRWLSRAFQDKRYIRVNGKPLFLVYNAGNLPDPLATTTRWREEAVRLGIGELYLGMVASFANTADPALYGFDASIEFPPHNFILSPEQPAVETAFDDLVIEYQDLVEAAIARNISTFKLFPGVTPSWDNSARRMLIQSHIYKDSTPHLYTKWLQSAITRSEQFEPEEQLVFINAWNEWGEAAYLEPDLKNGLEYLRATKYALTGNIEYNEGSNYREEKTFPPEYIAEENDYTSPVVYQTPEELITNLRGVVAEKTDRLANLENEVRAVRGHHKSLEEAYKMLEQGYKNLHAVYDQAQRAYTDLEKAYLNSLALVEALEIERTNIQKAIAGLEKEQNRRLYKLARNIYAWLHYLKSTLMIK